ncbi:hypothetical protein [Ulvibacter antarcticus]|uniref:Uncharacterized protein n=1 Tax=Ulvibacter antarcticus TaxID=442714 RepID=A0A3L9YDN3_9FLAO|nr:hypothetical protein [Ulvibacter antarcticus]RMA58806.1 hypothetical protein BXY75_2185 [Ulvibacter antarcticus]
MKKLLKPACIGFYILMLLAFFIAGLFFAGWIDAGKNQGLAGGAIVVGYGVMFGGIAFIASFFIAYYLQIKTLVKLNWLLIVLILVTYGYKHYEFTQRDKKQDERNDQIRQSPKTPTQTAEEVKTTAMFEVHLGESRTSASRN